MSIRTIMLFDPGTMLMQANTSIPSSTVVSTGTALDSIVALIVAIASIIGTVAAIIWTMTNKGAQTESKQAIRGAADYMKELGDSVIQAKEDIATLADVTYKMLPDQAKEIFNAQNVRLAELERKVREANEHLGRVPPALDHL